MQVGLATDQHDLTRLHRDELGHHRQRLLDGELVGASRARARAAVEARVIAAERELPHDVRGKEILLRDVEAAKSHDRRLLHNTCPAAPDGEARKLAAL